MNTLKPTGVGRTPHKVIQMLRTPGVHHTASASPQLLARSLHQACRGNRVCGGPFHTLAPQWSAVPECVLQQAKRQWVPDVCFEKLNVRQLNFGIEFQERLFLITVRAVSILDLDTLMLLCILAITVEEQTQKIIIM